MKTAIATVSISGTLNEKLAAIAAAGFDGVEIFENDFLTFDGTARDVGRMVRDHGLEISLFQPFRDFEGLPEPQRSQAFARAERKFDLMGELGAGLMLICSSVSPAALGGIDRAAADLAELGDIAASRGLRVGYEALAWGRYVNDHRDAWEIVRRADHPAVGLILDSFHTLARGIDPASIRAIAGDRIFFVQLADAPRLDMDLLSWSRHYRSMPGQGDLDVTGFMLAVASTGYAGPLSLEVFNDQFRGGSPGTIAGDGYRSLVNLADRVRRSEPDVRLDLPSLPAPGPARGVSFIEFAADEAETEALGRLFAAMGFAPVGTHVSKQVSLWRQGDINLVVNTERDSFAHASYLTHGVGVCDLGLSVDDAKATLERARALGLKPFAQPVGAGEIQIPAIRGVGGGVMRFLDASEAYRRVWETEFPDSAGQNPRGAGLTRVDHLAQTMNYEEMLTWVLFYLSLFEAEKRPMVDVVDPAGLVRSQAIESGGGAVRVTLNGAENYRTLAGRFLAESFGSGVQHMAFATDDIFATADALAARGFESLAIPENYYEDLAARFALEADFLKALADRNLLYDRDDAGTYLQLYSRSFGDSFFFEIVERQGRYAGYGASNAPFRIAAQKRDARSPAGGIL